LFVRGSDDIAANLNLNAVYVDDLQRIARAGLVRRAFLGNFNDQCYPLVGSTFSTPWTR
jgi:hypothetical protein